MADPILLEVQGKIEDALSKLRQLREEGKRTGDTLETEGTAEFVIQTDEAISQLEDLQSRTQALVDDERVVRFTGDTEEARREIDRLVDKAEDGLEEIRRKVRSSEPFDPLSDAISREAIELRREFDEIDQRFQQTVQRFNEAARRADFDPASREARELRAEIARTGQEVVDFSQRVPASLQQAGAGFSDLKQKAQAAGDGVKVFGRNLDEGGQQVNKLTRTMGLLRGAFVAFTGSIVVQRLIEFGRAITDVGVRLESLRNGFEAFLGSPQAAADELERISDLADQLGGDFESLSGRFLQLKSAGDAAGFSLQLTRDVFDAIAISATGMGKSVQDTDRIFRAFEQILSKGTVSAEEIRQQLGDLLPGALPRLAEALGVTTQELNKMLEAGEVLSNEAVPKLAAAFLEAFGPASIGNMESARAEMGRVRNEFVQLADKIAQQLLPDLKELLEVLQTAGRDSDVKGLGELFSRVISDATDLLEILQDIVSFNFKGFWFDFLEASLTPIRTIYDLLGELLERLNETFDAAIPDALIEKLRGVREVLDEAAEGFDIMADEARGSAQNIAEENNKRAREVAEAWEAMRLRLIKAGEEAADGQIEQSEKVKKREKKLLEERTDAFREFFKTIADLAKEQQPVDPGGPSTTKTTAGPKVGRASGVDELKRQLQELEDQFRELNSAELVTAGQNEQADQLAEKIAELRRRLTALEGFDFGGGFGEAFGAAGDQVTDLADTVDNRGKAIAKALKDLVTDSDEFADAFKRLPPTAQEAVQLMIGNLVKLAEEGTVTQERLRLFGYELAKIFEGAGVVTTDFAGKFTQAAGDTTKASDEIAHRLADLRNATEEAGKGADTLKQKTGDLGGGFVETKDKIIAWGDQVEQAKQKAAETGKEFEEQKQVVTDWGDKLKEAGEKAREGSGGIAETKTEVINLGGSLEEAKKRAEETGKKLVDLGNTEIPPKAKDSISDFEMVAAHAKEPVEQLGTAAQGASEGASALGTAVEKIKGGLETVAEKIRTFVGSLGDEFTTKTSAAGQALGTLQDPLSSIGEVLSTVVGALTGIGGQFEPLVTGLQQLAEKAAEEAESQALAGLAEIFGSLKEAVSGAAEKFQAVVDAVAAFIEKGEGIDTVAQKIEDALANLVTEQVVKRIQGFATDLGKVQEALEKSAQPSKDLATGLSDSAEAMGDFKTDAEELLRFVENQFATAISNLKSDFEAIVTALKNTQTELGTTGTKFDDMALQANAAVDSILAKLDALISKLQAAQTEAQQLATDLQSVQLPDDGAPPGSNQGFPFIQDVVS